MSRFAIESWLNGDRDFSAGVSLYDAYGSSEILKRTFAAGENGYTIAKLSQELESIYMSLEEHEPLPPVPMVGLPDDLREVEKQAKDLFKEMSYLHSTLENPAVNPTDEIRLSNALRIRELHLEIRERFRMVDHFRETGKRLEIEVREVKKAPDPEQLSPTDLVNRRNTLRTYVSKIEKQIATNPPAEKLLKLQSRLQKYKTELEAVLKRL